MVGLKVRMAGEDEAATAAATVVVRPAPAAAEQTAKETAANASAHEVLFSGAIMERRPALPKEPPSPCTPRRAAAAMPTVVHTRAVPPGRPGSSERLSSPRWKVAQPVSTRSAREAATIARLSSPRRPAAVRAEVASAAAAHAVGASEGGGEAAPDADATAAEEETAETAGDEADGVPATADDSVTTATPAAAAAVPTDSDEYVDQFPPAPPNDPLTASLPSRPLSALVSTPVAGRVQQSVQPASAEGALAAGSGGSATPFLTELSGGDGDGRGSCALPFLDDGSEVVGGSTRAQRPPSSAKVKRRRSLTTGDLPPKPDEREHDGSLVGAMAQRCGGEKGGVAGGGGAWCTSTRATHPDMQEYLQKFEEREAAEAAVRRQSAAEMHPLIAAAGGTSPLSGDADDAKAAAASGSDVGAGAGAVGSQPASAVRPQPKPSLLAREEAAAALVKALGAEWSNAVQRVGGSKKWDTLTRRRSSVSDDAFDHANADTSGLDGTVDVSAAGGAAGDDGEGDDQLGPLGGGSSSSAAAAQRARNPLGVSCTRNRRGSSMAGGEVRNGEYVPRSRWRAGFHAGRSGLLDKIKMLPVYSEHRVTAVGTLGCAQRASHTPGPLTPARWQLRAARGPRRCSGWIEGANARHGTGPLRQKREATPHTGGLPTREPMFRPCAPSHECNPCAWMPWPRTQASPT